MLSRGWARPGSKLGVMYAKGLERITASLSRKRKETQVMSKFSLWRRSDFCLFLLSQIGLSDLEGRKRVLRRVFRDWPAKFHSQVRDRKVYRAHDASGSWLSPPTKRDLRERIRISNHFSLGTNFINKTIILEVNRNRTNKHDQS